MFAQWTFEGEAESLVIQLQISLLENKSQTKDIKTEHVFCV